MDFYNAGEEERESFEFPTGNLSNCNNPFIAKGSKKFKKDVASHDGNVSILLLK